MIISMTGYGEAEAVDNETTAVAEVRCVNSRYLDVVVRLPRQLNHRENEVREIARSYISRGKLNISITLSKESGGAAPLTVNSDIARSYYKLLTELRKSVKIREQVKLEHLLQFSEIFDSVSADETEEKDWAIIQRAVKASLETLNTMRAKEGEELSRDLKTRLQSMGQTIAKIEQLSRGHIPEERKKLEEKVRQIVADPATVDQNRLELEILLLSEKLDVTEECVRFRSHEKFFLESIDSREPTGRRLNFLAQEMNREANTIASKSSDAEISRLIVSVKEELEKIREQLQNVE